MPSLREIRTDNKMQETTVFVLQHTAREGQDDEDVKFIGVYSMRSSADAAIARSVVQPGFRDFPNGFCVDEYAIDKDHWREGFAPDSHDR